jgi:hypothetical protein
MVVKGSFIIFCWLKSKHPIEDPSQHTIMADSAIKVVDTARDRGGVCPPPDGHVAAWVFG